MLSEIDHAIGIYLCIVKKEERCQKNIILFLQEILINLHYTVSGISIKFVVERTLKKVKSSSSYSV